MNLNRIRNKLKILLNEDEDKEKELEVPSFIDNEEEDEVQADDGNIDPENEKSGAAHADYGAGITPYDKPPKPKIGKRKSADPGVIGKKRERQSKEFQDKLKKGDYQTAINQFTVSDEELRKEIEDRFLSKWSTENLAKEPNEKLLNSLRKLVIEKKNDENKIADQMKDAVKNYNYYIAGPPTNRDAFGYIINKNAEGLGGDVAKSKFGGGGSGGNINDQHLALAVPSEDLVGNELIEAVKSSLMDAVRTPQHIINNFLGKEGAPSAPVYQTDEDAIQKLDNLESTLNDLPKFKNKHQILKSISKAKSEIEKMGIPDAFIGAKKIPVVKYIDYIDEKVKNAVEQHQQLSEALAPEDPAGKSKDLVDRFYNWFKNNKYQGILKKGQNALSTIFELMKQHEINQAIVNGILAKFRKLKNLGIDPGNEEKEDILADPDDFVAVLPDEEYEALMNDIQQQRIAESKNPYKRQRKLSKIASLKEAWKQNQEKIRKQHIEKQKEKSDMPDLHLGGLS